MLDRLYPQRKFYDCVSLLLIRYVFHCVSLLLIG